MLTAHQASLLFTVVLLVTTFYFLMGGLPLLILKHDTPVDARFIRRFFGLYYLTIIGGAVGATVSYALSGRTAFALEAAAIALLAVALRRKFLPAMESIGAQIQANHERAVERFRRIHVAALAVNFVQLLVLLWGLTQIRF